MLNYLDRNNIASARLAGLESDLHLTDAQYRLSVSILFVGYILMQIPSNFMLDKIGKPAPYLCTAMVIWGIISTATAATNSFGGLIACRFVLGFIEAAFFPGVLFLLSSWSGLHKFVDPRANSCQVHKERTRAENGNLVLGQSFVWHVLRTHRSWDFESVGSRPWSSSMEMVIVRLSSRLHNKGSHHCSIVEGAITIGVAIIAYFVLPNFPATTSWLSLQERQLAQWRLEADAGEADVHQKLSFGAALKMVFTDIKSYVLVLLILGIVSAAGVTNFFPSKLLVIHKYVPRD